eukprot:TRINITY_DN9763_c0_g1_i1.p1 TRINITY_DN9763_c0_g1~~TRINITY_DN9763_c0_g1_i1.p1  ORF type:complete len:277 (+),score=53.51 TRINITY_DN9763_c0_g1_i1:61-891(+)
MLEAILESGQLIKALVEGISPLVSEANLVCDGEGITLQAMDPAHVSLVALRLGAQGFARYRCDSHMTLGVSMVNLSKILKLCGKDDAVSMVASGGDKDVLQFKFESKNQGRINDVAMKLMVIDAESLEIPDQEYKCVFSMPAAEFSRVVRDMQVVGEAVTISVSKEGVEFSASGDFGSSSVKLKTSGASADSASDGLVVEVAKEKFSLSFALRYLSIFAKATVLSETVKLSLLDGNPLVVEFPIEGFGYLRYFLAPKVEDEPAEEGATAQAGGEFE